MAIYRCAVHYECGTVDMYNIYHITAADNQEGAIANSFQSVVGPSLLACLSTATTLLDITVTDLGSHTQATAVLTGSGTYVGDPLPPQCAAVISWRTAKVGRAYRGRTYIGGAGEGQQNNGQWGANMLTYMGSLATALRQSWPASCSGTFVLYHAGSGLSDTITTALIRDTVYTQRRRTLGYGI